MLIVLDVSIKNNFATSILYIHRGQEIITKNITSLETELFAI